MGSENVDNIELFHKKCDISERVAPQNLSFSANKLL